MNRTFTVLTIASLFLIFSCNSNSNNRQEVKEEVVRQLTEEELKEQLKQKECNNPNDYMTGKLSSEGKYKNALSLKINRMALNCNISNTATMAIFKDVKCHVKFLSKTGSTVIEKEFVIYEFFKPNQTVNYKTEISITNQQYKDINDVEWSIINATCE
jgi:hypothetical protein